MVHGNYVPILEDYQNVVAYTREYQNEKWLMIFNFQQFSQPIMIPDEILGEKRVLIMCNYPNADSMSNLRPYEGRIYAITAT